MRLRPCRHRDRLQRTLLALQDALAAYGSMSASAKTPPDLDTAGMAWAMSHELIGLVIDAGLEPAEDVPGWVPPLFEAVRERVKRDTSDRMARRSRHRRRTGR
jgi:hypothetical protein